jgi:hypothetical protein
MQKLIGYLHIREIDSFRYPIYENTLINFPSTHKKMNKPICILLSKETYGAFSQQEQDNDPSFPRTIYINGSIMKNINPENGKKIIDFNKDKATLMKSK